MERPVENRFRKIAAVCLVAIAIAGLIYSVLIEPDQLITKTYTVRLDNWDGRLDGLKIAVLSDLHIGSLHIDGKKLARIVDETNAQNADIILLLGDYAASGKGFVLPSEFTAQMSRLKAKLGVYAVLGNHDWWFNGVKVRSCLEAAHIKVLEDSSVEIHANGTEFWLVGLADLWTRKTSIERALAGVPSARPIVLMTHNPDVFPSIPPQVSLTLAGHTHGGQVALPIVGALITPSDYGSKYAKGLIVEDTKSMFVSSGIGTSVFPIRFNVPPEISVLELFKSDGSRI